MEVPERHDGTAADGLGVYRAIVGVSADIAKIGIAKDQRNQQQGYAFRGIDSTMNALAPLLAKHGLVILPRMLSRSVVERASRNGGVIFSVTVEMEFDFVCAADGSRHTVRMFGEAMDSADKATNKSASACYKYAAFQTFCIPTEGEDADATTHEPVIQLREDAPPAEVRADGFALIEDIRNDGKFWHITWGRDAQGGAMVYKTKIPHNAARAQEAYDLRVPVKLHSQTLPWLDRVETLVPGSAGEAA
jgi:hypothetical protein